MIMGLNEANIPETFNTLARQQNQLIDGRRIAQMFPLGTYELPIPQRMGRLVTPRGVFHFDPHKISMETIELLSRFERENVFLNLGPFNKEDILALAERNDPGLCIVERDWDGVELRCAMTCRAAFGIQMQYFMSTKEPDSVVNAEVGQTVLRLRTTGQAWPRSDSLGILPDNKDEGHLE